MKEWKSNGSPKMAAWFVQKLYGDISEEDDSMRITVGNPQGLYSTTDQDNLTLYIVHSKDEVVGKIDLIRTVDNMTLWITEFDSKFKERVEAVFADIKGRLQEYGWDVIDPSQPEQKTKSKRGPRRYSLKEKIAARKRWDKLDRDEHPIKLEEFLEDEFGSTGGKLNVATSTFYDWPTE